jgi:outer membrane protein TolC
VTPDAPAARQTLPWSRAAGARALRVIHERVARVLRMELAPRERVASIGGLDSEPGAEHRKEALMRRPEVAHIAAFVFALGLLACAPAHAQTDPAGEASDAIPNRALTLDDCIRIALERNLELRIARTDFGASRATVGEAAGGFWPVLSVTAGASALKYYGEFPQRWEHLDIGTAMLTQALPIGTLLQYSYGVEHFVLQPDRTDTPNRIQHFGIIQPLLRGGGWRAGTAALRTARYDARISQSGLQGAELSVVQQVKSAYYEVIRNSKLIEVNQKAVQRDSQLVRQSQSKLDAGLATKRDVLSAQIILAQDRGKLVDASTGHAQALDALARVMGLRLGRKLDIAAKDIDLAPLNVNEAAWVDKALRDNPTVRSAQLGLERAQHEMQVANNGRLPQLDLSVNWDKSDDPDLNEELKLINIQRAKEGNEPKDLKFTAFKGWSGFLTLSYPLGNRSPGSAYKRSRLLYEQARRTLEDVQLQVTLDIRSAIRALENNVQRLEILNKNIEGARSKLEFASINFQLGRASNLDVTEAQKDLLDAETDYVNEVIDYNVQLANIESLIGGFE